ncbi:hypothetical protein like AT1G19260 [Hibiscus trionum]|uniref:Uncharacterized protein n=1 Tax=Hibiscus trionum TaxID=183268 RepID=A0A9W7MEH9_HIBTR|nr:hypothetical protein like AT1G19260 [Hibiscus trionum]
MYNATRSVLEKIAIDRRATYSQRGDANSALKKLLTFDFVFILHMMHRLMGYTDALCRALQYKSQDILNAMDLVVATKSSIQESRDSIWEGLLQRVLLFCNKRDTLTLVPDMNATYSDIIRSRHDFDSMKMRRVQLNQ